MTDTLRGAGLWFAYHRDWVLRDVSIQVSPGEIVGLWGPSGCGKSTLARLLTGRLRPARGTVSMPAGRGRARSAQLVLQQADQSVNPRWKIGRILAEAAPDPAPVLDSGLVFPDWLGSFPHELSGGELQRVNLARALLCRPLFVVADEITASLDAITQVQIWRIILDGAARGDYGVLAVSHDMPLLDAVASRILAMEDLTARRGVLPGPDVRHDEA
ncbi:ABC transporter ATP-binding protein [Asanoa siamensis]|uniref:Peptide ABC transporter n=1 Tax=Asanoa siamensis TaxID=926357 RepID=A0ABQ4D100_9ACTN|nr:ATP-binding cassette domain-containing protein [Asanoa siamensis]GIF77222.1 peptide ABC transporter [Asanoa siamensis]